MKKSLQTVEKTETALILKKSNMLLGITKKILSDKLVLKKTTDIVLNNKVWQDPDTGLIWQVDIYAPEDYEDAFTWKESFEYAKRLNREKYGGYDDWRVPSKEELLSIMTEESFENEKSYEGETYIKEPLLNSMSMKYQWFWSTTESNNNSSQAWYVYFNYGGDGCNRKSDNTYVRCVRERQ